MKSLEELNQYALSPITYTDNRPAEVFFDRGATEDQYIEVNENTTFFFPYGIEIEDITQYDIAQIEYVIDLSVFTSNAVYLSWPSSVTLPSYVSTTRVGNVFTISGMRSRSDWDLVKTVRVQPPFSISGFKPLEGKLTWFANASATTRTEAVWDVQLNLIPVEYFGPAALELYTANLLDQQIAAPEIIVDPDEFDPEWTLEISPSVLGAVTEIYSTSVDSNATASWNNTTKTYTIVGDKTAVNNTLDGLEVDYARSDSDMTFLYLLRNNYNLVTESQIQIVESRDFISDIDLVINQSIPGEYIFGIIEEYSGEFTVPDLVRPPLIRDPNPTTLASSNIVEATVGAIRPAEVDPVEIVASVPKAEPYRTRPGSSNVNVSAFMSVTPTRIRFSTVAQTFSAAASLSSTSGHILIDNTAGIMTFHTDYGTPEIYAGRLYTDIDTQYGEITVEWIDEAGTVTTQSDTPSAMANFVYSGGSTGYITANIYGQYNDFYVSSVTYKSNSGSDTNALTRLERWSTNFVAERARLLGNRGLISVPTDLPSSITDASYMFSWCDSFSQNLSTWDVSNVETFQAMFNNASSFNGSLNNWDTSSVQETGMNGMFKNASSFNQPVNHFRMPNVGVLLQTFYGASSFNQTVEDWDWQSRPNNLYDFYGTGIFFTDINATQGVYELFYGATSFNKSFNGKWDGKFKYIKTYEGMFRDARSFNQDISGWNTVEARNMNNMFYNGTGTAQFDQDLSNWSVPYITSQPTGWYRPLGHTAGWTTDEFPVWGDSYAIDMDALFFDLNMRTFNFHIESTLACDTGTEDDLLITLHAEQQYGATLYVNIVDGYSIEETTPNTYDMSFVGAPSGFIDWPDGSRTQIIGDGSYSYTFNGDGSDLPVRISGNLPYVRTAVNYTVSSEKGTVLTPILEVTQFAKTTRHHTFSDCQTEIAVPNTLGENMRDLQQMFYKCYYFTGDTNMSSWDTSNVVKMSGMFQKATAFNTDISSWDTSKCDGFMMMFNKAESFNYSLESWDLSAKDVSATTGNNDLNSTHFSFYAKPNNDNQWGTAVQDNDWWAWNTNAVYQSSNAWIGGGLFSFLHGATSYNSAINDVDTTGQSVFVDFMNGCSSFNQPLTNFNFGVDLSIYSDNPLPGWTQDFKPKYGVRAFANMTSFNNDIHGMIVPFKYYGSYTSNTSLYSLPGEDMFIGNTSLVTPTSGYLGTSTWAVPHFDIDTSQYTSRYLYYTDGNGVQQRYEDQYKRQLIFWVFGSLNTDSGVTNDYYVLSQAASAAGSTDADKAAKYNWEDNNMPQPGQTGRLVTPPSYQADFTISNS